MSVHPLLEVHRHSQEHPWTYALLDQRQRELAQRIREGGPGVLLMSELSPVITLGRRARPETLKLSFAEFHDKGIEIYSADRGGLETYHGPGQWVVFALENLERLTGDPRAIKEAVCRLLRAAQEVALPYRPDCEVKEGMELGVWSSLGKFAALGVHLVDGVLLHGISVNAFRTETSFLGLNPCGMKAPLDFLLESRADTQAMLDPELAFARLGKEFQAAVLKHFWKKNESVDDT